MRAFVYKIGSSCFSNGLNIKFSVDCKQLKGLDTV